MYLYDADHFYSKVQSCLVSNSPCFWSQKEWSNVLKACRDDPRTNVRNKWFVDNFRLLAHLSTLIADCSELLLVMDRNGIGFNPRRRILTGQIQRVEKMSAKLCDAKVKELSESDPEADLFAVFDKLSESEEDRKGYPFNYLAAYVEAMIICPVLRVALGGKGALASFENTCTLVEWLDQFHKRMKPGESPFAGLCGRFIKATQANADKWRVFAAETEACTEPRNMMLVEPDLFRRWLIDAEIKPRG